MKDQGIRYRRTDHHAICTDEGLELDGLSREITAVDRIRLVEGEAFVGMIRSCGCGHLRQDDMRALLAGGPL